MILYTVASYEVIFGGEGVSTAEDVPRMGTSPIAGGFVEWVQDADGRHVSRLCSTNPADYLRADYTPGAPWRPQKGGRRS